MEQQSMKPCMYCGAGVPAGYLRCAPCTRYDTMMFLERQRKLAEERKREAK